MLLALGCVIQSQSLSWLDFQLQGGIFFLNLSMKLKLNNITVVSNLIILNMIFVLFGSVWLFLVYAMSPR